MQYLSAVLDTRTCKEAEVTTRSDLSMDKTLVLMVTHSKGMRLFNSSIFGNAQFPIQSLEGTILSLLHSGERTHKTSLACQC